MHHPLFRVEHTHHLALTNPQFPNKETGNTALLRPPQGIILTEQNYARYTIPTCKHREKEKNDTSHTPPVSFVI